LVLSYPTILEYRCVSEIQEVKCSKLNCTANFPTLWTLCEPCSHQSSTERENLRNSYRLSQFVAWIRMRLSDIQEMYLKTAASFYQIWCSFSLYFRSYPPSACTEYKFMTKPMTRGWNRSIKTLISL